MNFQSTLNEIAWEWVTSEESQARLRLLGVDPAQWPQSKIKDLLVEFEKTGSEKIRHSLVKALNVADRWPLPGTEGEFKGLYESELKTARGRELANEIMRRPGRADELISLFQSSKSLSQEFLKLEEVFHAGVKDLEKRMQEGRAFVEIPKWPILSKGIGGFNGGRVILLTAKTGFGKTTLALNWILNMAEKMPSVMFNMEMPASDLAPKLYQSISADSLSNWYKGVINYEAISRAIDKAKNKVLISKGTSLAIDQITSAIFVLTKDQGPSFFIVDYDQKISTRSGLDEWKGLQIAIQELEQVAIKTESTVVLLSQANDDGDPRASKRMVQSAATHLVFDQDEDGVFIQARKNRFGKRDFRVSVSFIPEMASVSEGSEFFGAPSRGFNALR